MKKLNCMFLVYFFTLCLTVKITAFLALADGLNELDYSGVETQKVLKDIVAKGKLDLKVSDKISGTTFLTTKGVEPLVAVKKVAKLAGLQFRQKDNTLMLLTAEEASTSGLSKVPNRLTSNIGSKKLKMDFTDMPLSDILHFISIVGEVNVGFQISYNDYKMTLKGEHTVWEWVNIVCEKAKLEAVEEDGVILITEFSQY